MLGDESSEAGPDSERTLSLCLSCHPAEGVRREGRKERPTPDTHAGMWERQGLGEAKTPVETTGQRETPVRLYPPPPGARQSLPRWGESGGSKGVGTLASPPSSGKSLHLTTRVLLFLQLHLPFDRSWRCRDSAPQGAGSAGSYIPRSGGGFRCHLRREGGGQCPLFGGSCDSSLEGSLDPLSGGCMNSNVDSTGAPCVCTLSGELGWQNAHS